jgi:hypothetical protein
MKSVAYRIIIRSIFVGIITQKQNSIQVVALRDVTMSIVKSALIILTAGYSKTKIIYSSCRQRSGAAQLPSKKYRKLKR